MNQALQKQNQKLKKPSKFVVILLNDDYTDMDFVVEVLQLFFAKTPKEADTIMLKIHTQGEAVCAVYSYDIAQTKAKQVIAFARNREYPLVCIVRRE